MKDDLKEEGWRLVDSNMQNLCAKFDLLHSDENNVMRLPFLIKGSLRTPARVDFDDILRAFDAAEKVAPAGAFISHAQLEKVQVLREPVINRKTMRPTGAYQYSVMPVFSPREVLENDFSALCALYNTPFQEILELLKSLGALFAQEKTFLDSLRDLTIQTAQLPDQWHNLGFDALGMLIDPCSAKAMVDKDLGVWGLAGSRFLDGWVELPGAAVLPAPVHLIAAQALGEAPAWESRKPSMRAMPTRQLHITAGNAPQIPFISALRAILTKSAAVIKSPYGATLPGALLSLGLPAAAPDHPITRHLSIVYWPGGEAAVEDAFFAPNAFDRIVVWGAPDAVESVKKRALFTKVLTFNPRYGVSMIGREAFAESLEDLAAGAVADSLVANQKACIASQIHYIEADEDQARLYAQALQRTLAAFDRASPNYVDPFFVGEVKRVMRGVLIDGDWFVNSEEGRFCSGVVLVDREIPLSAVTMQRMIIVRRLDRLESALPYLHPGVSTVSMAPLSVKERLRDEIAARGVSNIVDLGHSGTMFPGMSHDGMMALSELVDWKNG
ncbi:acyl-CoA reductase [Desulfatibacillum aliphaticivorans]|uniref:Acyl-CoA reductase n=1 Tax=Desulfatibacillum aliphaticivorans TaxID=218208 RepID=B8F9B3_DESAL|nr:acyl-CoA reductase [Desulfatibacillum aliphaticivorans]ACL02859.1 acyl-CoA reductase [Desulfatibacillum aliphaticivorans]